jgi:PAS domain S-box-containing protein
VFQDRTGDDICQEEDLEREVLCFKNLFLNSPDGLVIFDNNDIIRAFNRGSEEIFGYKSSGITGLSWHLLIPDDLRENGEVDRLRSLVEGDRCIDRCFVTRKHKKGHSIKLELTRTVLKNKNGDCIGYMEIFRDLTLTIAFEHEIRLSEKLAALGTLVSGLAHELGTPLNVIMGHAELIMSDLEADSSHNESLETILSACNRMTAIMKSLLQFVSQREPDNHPVDIKDVLEDLMNFLRIQFRKQGIETRLDIPDKLPPISGDRTQIEEIFLNVIMNGIHSMAFGGKLLVKVYFSKEGGWDYIVTEIVDDGCGIPADSLNRIFDPFFTTREVGKGTGLGLYITHSLIQRNKGSISIESTVDEGTSVRIMLPVGP